MGMRTFKRPPTVPAMKRTPPRTRTAAATELARLEFERERLMREHQILSNRDRTISRTLERIERRASVLHDVLDFGETAEPEPDPEPQPVTRSRRR